MGFRALFGQMVIIAPFRGPLVEWLNLTPLGVDRTHNLCQLLKDFVIYNPLRVKISKLTPCFMIYYNKYY